jgi:hypothetical protein
VKTGLEPEFLQPLHHVLGRALDIGAIVEHEIPPSPKHIVVQEFPVTEIHRAEHIFRVKMVSRRAGNSQVLGHSGRNHLDYEGLFKMHHIGPLDRLLYDGNVSLGKLIPV